MEADNSIRVFSKANLPTRLHPLALWTIVTWLFLDRLGAPSWMIAAAAGLFSILWFFAFCLKLVEKQVKVRIED